MAATATDGIRWRIQSLVSGRVYPSVFPPNATMPCITVHGIDLINHHAHQVTKPLQEPRIQLTHWGRRKEHVTDLGQATYGLLNGYGGRVTTPDGAINLPTVLHISDTDDYDPETQLYKLISDYRCFYAAA